MIEVVAGLVFALLAAIGWAFVERRGRHRASAEAAAAVERALLNRRRVRVESDRREAAEVAATVHRAAIDGARADRRAAEVEVEANREEIAAADDAEKAARLAKTIGAGLIVLAAAWPSPAAAAPPCAGAEAVGDRVAVSVRCVQYCATLDRVALPAARASLVECRAAAAADAKMSASVLAACDRQVVAQRKLLEIATAAPSPPSWYRSPFLWAGVGLVTGAAATYAALDRWR